MDFHLSAEEQAFRDMVTAFVHANADECCTIDDVSDRHLIAWSPTFSKRLAAEGWLGLPLPKEHGGGGLNPLYQAIFNEVMAYYRAPLGAHWRGVYYVAPVLITFGTEAQKRRFLPRILNCEMFFCTGFSEPQAGSDLASLSTTAIRQGDHYIVNGQKIWTTDAHNAGWAWLAARTDTEAPKHKGISNFALDLSLPGVDIQPLQDLNGEHHFNQVFFDNVMLPAEDLIGEENRGWYQTAASLDFERSSIANFASSRRSLDDLLAYVKGRREKVGLSIRMRIADLYTKLLVGQAMAYNVAFLQASGMIPNKEASIAKLMSSEIKQELFAVTLGCFGMDGQVRKTQRTGQDAAREYAAAVSATIAGGSSEVQRSIIATRGVGLPRA